MTERDPYAEVPYEGQPIPGLSPEHLLRTSWLHGGPRPPLERCRVLELGCGDGANLLPLAFYSPGSSFVGIDAAAGHIARARDDATALGLENVRFETGDIRALRAEELGELDYVLCHGVFSWVPDETRRAILELCRAVLAPSGIAAISYNALPGWRARGLVREVLMRATDPRSPALERAAKAKAHAMVLASLAPEQHPYGALFARELRLAAGSRDSYFVHEYLAEENRAFWLGELVELAESHRLVHVAESSWNVPGLQPSDSVRAALAPLGLLPIQRDETLDAILYRQFRTSLLCRDDAPRGAGDDLELVRGCEVALGLQPAVSEVPIDPGVDVTFKGRCGYEMDVCDPTLKVALLLAISRWPVGTPFARLTEEVREALVRNRIPPPRDLDIEDLGYCMLDLYRAGQADLRLTSLPARATVGPRMRAHALARYEATRREVVTTRTHESLPMDPVGRALLARLDGTRDVAALLEPITRAAPSDDARAEIADKARAALELLAAWGVVEPVE